MALFFGVVICRVGSLAFTAARYYRRGSSRFLYGLVGRGGESEHSDKLLAYRFIALRDSATHPFDRLGGKTSKSRKIRQEKRGKFTLLTELPNNRLEADLKAAQPSRSMRIEYIWRVTQ